jgi:hypothetical protein
MSPLFQPLRLQRLLTLNHLLQQPQRRLQQLQRLQLPQQQQLQQLLLHLLQLQQPLQQPLPAQRQQHHMKVQWMPLNWITLGQTITDPFNRMIPVTEHMSYKRMLLRDIRVYSGLDQSGSF